MRRPHIFQTFGSEQVTVVHNPGTDDETRTDVEAHIQAQAGFFAVDTPIYEGDVVELDDPRGGRDRRLVREVHINNPRGAAFSGMEHIEVKWGKAPTPRIAPVRRLTVEKLHPDVIRPAGDLFADGHFESAVSEAFKSLDVRVRDLIGSTQSGTKLMSEAFGGAAPRIDVSESAGQSGPRRAGRLRCALPRSHARGSQPEGARAVQGNRSAAGTGVPRPGQPVTSSAG